MPKSQIKSAIRAKTISKAMGNDYKISILLHSNVSIGLSLLMKDIFLRANRFSDKKFKIDFVSVDGGFLNLDDLQIKTLKASTHQSDMLIVPPFNSSFNFDLSPFNRETKFLRKIYKENRKISSACLGSLLLANAGLLDKKQATTHWRASAFAQDTFPTVQWALEKMICDNNSVITSGGYLAAVDLALYLIETIFSRKVAHELGQYLLAGSVRQKQSVYAQKLAKPLSEESSFYQIEKWIAKNMHRPLSIAEMASQSGMSVRTFYRKFTSELGISPNKYLQLKRIEKAKILLMNDRLSMEEILEKIGLMDAVSFRKVFYRELGISPAEFRRRVR